MCRRVKKEDDPKHLISSAMTVLKDKCREFKVTGKYRLAKLVRLGDKVRLCS